MNISFEHYRIFYFVAQSESITRAAKILHSNQPNVTRVIKALEENLGCALFTRSHSGVILTPEGKKLYSHVKVAVENIMEGENEVTQSRALKKGTVSIATSEIALHCSLLPILKEYREAYPGVRIKVFSNTSPEAIEMLNSSLADLAIVTKPGSLPKTLKYQKIMEVQEIPVAGAPYKELKNRALRLEELAEYPLIGLGQNTATSSFYGEVFSREGLRFIPDIEVSAANQILPMVKSGLGIGFVPLSFAEADIKEGAVFPLSLKTAIPKRTICLLRAENQRLTIAAKELEKMILESAR